MLRWIRQWWMNRRLAKARADLKIDIETDETGFVELPTLDPYSRDYRPVRGEVLHGYQKLKGSELYITNKAFAVQGDINFRKGWKSIGDIHFLLNGYKLYPRNGRARFFPWKKFEPDIAVLIDVMLAGANL